MGSTVNINNDYFGNITNKYSASLSNEIAVLQRKVYLPLLPLEYLTDYVLTAYRECGRYYWFKDNVFKAKEGNFYSALLFPLVKDGESKEILNEKPAVHNINQEKLETKDYVTRNYINLTIPRHIILQFSNLIPKGTEFNISFFGGNDSNHTIKIVSVAKTVPIPKTEFDDSMFDTTGMSYPAVLALVQRNLGRIAREEARRKKEEAKYAKSKK